MAPLFPADTPTADIATVNYSKLLSGDDSQAQAIYEAAKGCGFFYLSDHDIDSSSMFGLADAVFELPLDEKLEYDMGTTGHYFGYKRSGAFVVAPNGARDHSQFYNISKNDMLAVGQPTSTFHPKVINDSHAPIQRFMISSHQVVGTVLRTLSKKLGLDEEALSRMHQIDRPSACQTRLTHAPPLESGVISVGEHTDFGSVTVLFNQLGGLQVLSPNSKEWMYVKPQPGSAIINLGDGIVKLVGGRLYSGLHRVVGPPGEQAKYDRHSVVYFCRPNSDVKLRSIFPEDKEDEESALFSDEWIAQRAKSIHAANYRNPELKKFRVGTAHNAGESSRHKVDTAVAAN